MFAFATRYDGDPGVSVLFRAEIACCHTDDAVMPGFRLPPDMLQPTRTGSG